MNPSNFSDTPNVKFLKSIRNKNLRINVLGPHGRDDGIRT